MLKASKTQFWVSMSKRLDMAIRRESHKLGISKPEFVRNLIHEYFVKQGLEPETDTPAQVKIPFKNYNPTKI